MLIAFAAFAFAASLLGACNSGTNARPGTIEAVGAENEYGNVISQIGGKYVSVTSILNNPNTDPHTFESSPTVAEDITSAQLIVQNGVGYDSFMNRIESASPSSSRKIIVAQNLLGLPNDTANPHLWYSPTTMPAVAEALAKDLSQIQPGHASYFHSNATKFVSSLQPWLDAIKNFKQQYSGTAAATTEPVADYMLTAMGIDNRTPWRFQADIMNGVDPAPQDISLEQGFFSAHSVKVFCYNQQVVDSLTEAIRQDALNAGVPVVGVYETMPTPGYDYQSWMLAELNAIKKAITQGLSTEHL
jgi:zinc/manganese transport system substrate-binding protein